MKRAMMLRPLSRENGQLQNQGYDIEKIDLRIESEGTLRCKRSKHPGEGDAQNGCPAEANRNGPSHSHL